MASKLVDQILASSEMMNLFKAALIMVLAQRTLMKKRRKMIIHHMEGKRIHEE